MLTDPVFLSNELMAMELYIQNVYWQSEQQIQRVDICLWAAEHAEVPGIWSPEEFSCLISQCYSDLDSGSTHPLIVISVTSSFNLENQASPFCLKFLQWVLVPSVKHSIPAAIYMQSN